MYLINVFGIISAISKEIFPRKVHYCALVGTGKSHYYGATTQTAIKEWH
jgi:hypothetical protein